MDESKEDLRTPNTPNPENQEIPPLKKRIQTFSDDQRRAFLKTRIKKFSSGKGWITFSWRELVQFFDLRGAFKLTEIMGGKRSYPAERDYSERSADYGVCGERWLRTNRDQLRNAAGEEVERIVYEFLRRTYFEIPCERLFRAGDKLFFGPILPKTLAKLIKIQSLLKQKVPKKVIAMRLGFTPSALSYYLKAYDKVLCE